MVKSKASNTEATTEKSFVTTGGTIVEGNVVTGKDNKLTARQQAAKSKGELDENNNPIEGEDKVAEAEKAVGTKSASIANAALTEKEKATDAKLEERRKVLEAAGEGDAAPAKAGETLYQGHLTVSGTASTTGEPISVKYEQVEPTGEDGVYHAFKSYFPAAKREGMKIDPSNTEDPTLRTYLERGTRRS